MCARARPSLLLLLLLLLRRRVIRRPRWPWRRALWPTAFSPSRSSRRRSRTTSLPLGSATAAAPTAPRRLLSSYREFRSLQGQRRPPPRRRLFSRSAVTRQRRWSCLARPRLDRPTASLWWNVRSQKNSGATETEGRRVLCACPVLVEHRTMKHDNGSFSRRRPKCEPTPRPCRRHERHGERGGNKKGTCGCASIAKWFAALDRFITTQPGALVGRSRAWPARPIYQLLSYLSGEWRGSNTAADHDLAHVVAQRHQRRVRFDVRFENWHWRAGAGFLKKGGLRIFDASMAPIAVASVFLSWSRGHTRSPRGGGCQGSK